MSEFNKAIESELRREEEDFKDLKQDFDFVVELNTQLANKYEDLMTSFPTVQELDTIINNVTTPDRIFQLKRFRSALVMLEKQDQRMKPARYDGKP